METRRLGTTDLELTTVGLGTWAIGGPWDWGWGVQDDADSLATIGAALDLGINWIDTAPCYGLGHSEEIVGRAIRGKREQVIVATKCGLVWDDPASGTVYGRLTADSVRREVEDSLRRLSIDVIDLYQIHWPNPESEIEEAWEAMARLREQGKIRHMAVSNFSVAQMQRAQTIAPIASLQPPYSMLRRDIEDEILPFCSEHGIGVVAYSPMQAGLLTGTFSHARLAALEPDDWRFKSEHFREPRFSRCLEQVEALTPIAQRSGRSIAELAIAWTLRTPVMTAAIVGARRPDQIRETASASGWQLSGEDVAEIESILA